MKQYLSFALSAMILIGCANKQHNSSTINAVSSIKENVSLDSLYKPKYKYIKEEDESYTNIKRLIYRVTFDKGLSYEEITKNLHFILQKAINKGADEVSIFIYYPEDDIRGPYTIGHLEFNKDKGNEPQIEIHKSYFEKTEPLISKGTIVILNTKKEYDRNIKKFVPTKRTKLYTLPDDLEKWDYVANGTKGTVIEVYSKRLTPDYTSIAYKVQVSKVNKQGWVLEDYVSIVK